MNIEFYSVLFMAFGLGMLHALDVDHVIAVSGMSCQKPDKKNSLYYCARWASGHGLALLLIGGAVLFMGMAIPEHLSAVAENLVGFVLIVIGLIVPLEMYRQRAHLHFHRHPGFNQLGHWHSHTYSKLSHKEDRQQHKHTPIYVGVLHGTAGSAPLLVLLPLSQMSSPWTGMGYLLLFGLGVFVSMLIFGGALGQMFIWMRLWGDRFINVLRLSVSLLSIGYGAKLVAGLF